MKLEDIDKLLSEITQGELTACIHKSVLDMGDAGKWVGHVDDQHGRGLASFCVGTEVPGIGKVTKKEAIANCKLYAAAPTIIKDLVERVRLLEDVLGRCESLADNGADDPAGPYNVLQQVVNTICAVLYTKEST